MRDLQPLLRIAVPSLAAALAGMGVLIVLLDHPASSASRMAEAADPVPSAARPCEQQSWPHIDRRCLSASTAQASRKVRLITTDRLETPPAVEPLAAAQPEPAAPLADAVATAPPAPQPSVVRPAVQIPVMAMTEVQARKPARRTAKRERRRATATVQRSYEVPAYDAHGTRRVTVTTQSRYEELFAPPRF
jgi:hypothetical protein